MRVSIFVGHRSSSNIGICSNNFVRTIYNSVVTW